MATILPKSFLDDVKSRLRLSDVVGRKVKLVRKGREFAANCPFHAEKSPSFYVNDEKEFFHCFGCGAHGDHFGFVMRHDNVDFMDAVERLAAEAGVTVPRPSAAEVERISRHDHLIRVMQWATDFFGQQLQDKRGRAALDYLKDRRVKDETMTAFRLGYAPSDGKELFAHLKNLGASEQDMLDVGLCKRSERDGGLFPFFRDRLLFPVMDKRGRTVAFGGRVLPGTEGADKGPKYLNSGETALFQKGQMLFNESHARTAAASGKPVIVTEGYLDVIACWQSGFMGAVAPLGTALTEAQILGLWDMTARGDTPAHPYLCFDGDAAGGRAALRALDRMLPLLSANRTAAFVFLPNGLDPDDVIVQRGEAAFGKLLAEAKPFVEVLWQAITDGRPHATPEQKASLQKAIDDKTSLIADGLVQREYKRALRDMFYERIAGVKKFQPFANTGKKAGKSAVPPPTSQFLADNQVPLLLGLLAYDPDVYLQVDEDVGRLHISDPHWDKLRQTLIAFLQDTEAPQPADVLAHLEQSGQGALLPALQNVLRDHAVYIFRKPDTSKSVRLFRAICDKRKS